MEAEFLHVWAHHPILLDGQTKAYGKHPDFFLIFFTNFIDTPKKYIYTFCIT